MSFVGAIKDAFYALENPENAHWMRQYMRNKYLFIGIKKPEQALVFKDLNIVWLISSCRVRTFNKDNHFGK